MSDHDPFELGDWQRAMFTPHFGDPFDLTPYLAWPQRRPGKHHATVGLCASYEYAGMPWDVVGPNAPRIRREARELAARWQQQLDQEDDR